MGSYSILPINVEIAKISSYTKKIEIKYFLDMKTSFYNIYDIRPFAFSCLRVMYNYFRHGCLTVIKF